MLDSARAKTHSNQSLSIILLADTGRLLADAATRMERIMRSIMLAKAKQLAGRWPMVATKQRDDVEDLTSSVLTLLDHAQDLLGQTRVKVQTNPSLAETQSSEVAHTQARALTLVERIIRLLLEAGIGRD